MKSKICNKIEELKGTTNSLDMDEFTIAELQVLDEHIFECEQCGWWCELNEMSENHMVCMDCNDET